MLRHEGAVLGSEGSGVIVEVGEGVDANLVGKKASFLLGAWTTHAVVPINLTIILDDSQDLKQAANAIINPLTAAA